LVRDTLACQLTGDAGAFLPAVSAIADVDAADPLDGAPRRAGRASPGGRWHQVMRRPPSWSQPRWTRRQRRL